VSRLRESRRFLHGGIATPHYLASAAGARVLESGGNAVDAIVAANLALGVVAPYYCGYGGDLLALVWDGSLHGYWSIGRAPAAAMARRVRDAAGAAEMPVFGPHAVTVPGAVLGWFRLLDRFGTRSFGDLAGDAVTLAEEGFPLTARGSASFAFVRALHERDAFSRPVIEAYSADRTGVGQVLRQERLAAAIRLLAADGPDAYYRGPIGAAIVETLQSHGGLMDAADLAGHADAWPEPVTAGFRGAEVSQLPPPTQGVTVLEALSILDDLDLGDDGPDRHHLLVEAVKIALASRDRHVGDPDVMARTPAQLLDADRVARLRAGIDPARRRDPPARPAPDGGTAYMCCADRDGNMVSLIQSNFAPIGSGVRVAEWGINLHNRGSSFLLTDDHPNSIGPRKRPMHTLIPGFVRRDGLPWLAFGTEGGHRQAQTQVQMLTRLLVDGAELQAALDAPRWGVDLATWRVDAERRFPAEWVAAMVEKGHEVATRAAFDTTMGLAHAIAREAQGYAVATDPRAEGAALGS
jgi:gamma-glutamyltranspeptidase/glutathione hydrolase